MDLAELRRQLAELNHLPGNTPVVLAADDEGNSFSPLATVAAALYQAENSFSGEWHPTEEMRAVANDGEWDPAPDSAVPAVFLWPTN